MGHHIVGCCQILVIGVGIVVSAAHLYLQALHPGNIPGDGHVGLCRQTLREIVAGERKSRKGAVRGGLVVGHSTRVVVAHLFGKEGQHADGLVRDGEITHLVGRTAAVRAAGEEAGRTAVSEHTAETGGHGEIFSHLGFHVRTQVETGIVVSFDITLLSQVTGADEVTDLVVAALEREVVLVVDTGAEHLLDVVHIIPAVGGVAVGHGGHILLREVRDILRSGGDGAVGHLVHHLGHVVIVGVLGAVHEFGEVGIHGNAHRAVIGDVHITLVTLLGGDDDHTACGLEAVYGSGGSVLQDRDAFDVGGIDIIDVAHREAVHHVGDSVDRTADTQRSLVQARFAGFLHRGKAGKLAGQHL